MINKLLFCGLLFCAAAVTLAAQEKPKLPDCRKYPVEDSDKRDFIDRNSFALDADGDGKPDRVTTNIYTVKTDYAVYALVLCSVNPDDKPDLLFYAGDESGDEAVILANDNNRFKVYSRKLDIDY